jgi:hypothetical protein
MAPCPETLRKRLIDHASEPYRAAGKFAYHFARGKLGNDPMSMTPVEFSQFVRREIEDTQRVLKAAGIRPQ